MRCTGFLTRFTTILTIFTLTLWVATASAATHETVLHVFNPQGADGTDPWASFVSDAAGNLYTTTGGGGAFDYGAVIELTPARGSIVGWSEKVIYSFKNNGIDANTPVAGLAMDAAGNLYGTTVAGGTNQTGTVFELTPNGHGGWTEKILHTFGNGSDGWFPYSSLIFDQAGNLYGTTEYGGDYSSGTAFELMPDGYGSWTERILYSFTYMTDGRNPHSGMIFDTAGNLYGTTPNGGAYQKGAVFELSPNGSGGWNEQLLYSFNGKDGAFPSYGSLLFDKSGNLYGGTRSGGSYGLGTVFELKPMQGGGWSEQVLHSFGNGTDGSNVLGGLVMDAAGNLYGTTETGGTYNWGTAFELKPSQGTWTEEILHNFNFNGVDGYHPMASLILDADGDLYGTTAYGGFAGDGMIFELLPLQGGGWAEKVVHSLSFSGTEGDLPVAGLISDAAGNLYGTTDAGGRYDWGNVFQLTPNGHGGWSEKVLHEFNLNGTDGGSPQASLLMDGAGNLYGTTLEGGAHDFGTVFELTPDGHGGWVEKVLHSFNSNGTDGYFPSANLVMDRFGNLYGTTGFGGTYDFGTAFELSPNGSGVWNEQVLYSFGNGTDGYYLLGGLILDASGNLYGTAQEGGTYGAGIAFELTPAQGNWVVTVLWSFGNGTDAYFPTSALVFDGAGNLYGTASNGGSNGYGAVFELSPSGQGWTEQVLYSFSGGSDGGYPYASLIFDHAGNLYSTTYSGGSWNLGTVFELTPIQGTWVETVLHSFNPKSIDGAYPQAGLLFDNSGTRLYGMTTGGGINNLGVVFQIMP